MRALQRRKVRVMQILVAVDGSAASLRGLDEAGGLKREPGMPEWNYVRDPVDAGALP